MGRRRTVPPPEVLILGCAVGAFMILVARPVVFCSLSVALPVLHHQQGAALCLVVGLRGAAKPPILFAIFIR